MCSSKCVPTAITANAMSTSTARSLTQGDQSTRSQVRAWLEQARPSSTIGDTTKAKIAGASTILRTPASIAPTRLEARAGVEQHPTPSAGEIGRTAA